MFRWASLLLCPPLLVGALFHFVSDDPAFSLLETLLAVFVIVGFAVAATGWIIRHDA